MLPHIILLCRNPHTSLGAQISLTHIPGLAFARPSSHTMFHGTKLAVLHYLKILTPDIRVLFFLGLTLRWENLYNDIIVHTAPLYRYFLAGKVSQVGCDLFVCKHWCCSRHDSTSEMFAQGFRQEKRLIGDLHPTEIAARSQVGFLGVSNDSRYLHWSN